MGGGGSGGGDGGADVIVRRAAVDNAGSCLAIVYSVFCLLRCSRSDVDVAVVVDAADAAAASAGVGDWALRRFVCIE